METDSGTTPESGPELNIEEDGGDPEEDAGATSDAGQNAVPDAGPVSNIDAGPIFDDAGAPQEDAGASDAGGNTHDAGASDGGITVLPLRVELLSDRHFSRGFNVNDPISGVVNGTIAPAGSIGPPQWQLGQWGSQTSLDDVNPTLLSSGATQWQDQFSGVTIGATTTSDADLSLFVNAFEEYGGVYRAANAIQTWPHLLGEQRISDPGTDGPGCPPLTELSALDFSVDAKLLFDNRNIGAGYNQGRHAAAYLVYFTVQNLNVGPDPLNPLPGYGDYLWFGLTFYDDREAMPQLAVAGDDATGKLIYNIGLAPLSGTSLIDNQWHLLSEDLLPHILLALDEAWSRGYLPDSQNVADYRIGGMNLGWEIPGLNETELQIRDLSFSYTLRTPEDTPLIRFDFNDDSDAEGWTAANLEDLNDGPLNGQWMLRAAANDPQLTSPSLQVQAAAYSTLEIVFENDGNPLASSRLQVFWSKSLSPGFSEAQSTWIDVDNNGGFLTYAIDLESSPTWTGTIDRLRIDPIESGDGHEIGIDSIVLTP